MMLNSYFRPKLQVGGGGDTLSTETLLKEKNQYSWPPCTTRFRSVTSKAENIFFYFYKTTYLNVEVYCT
jgi:hypothetical protein